MKKLIFLLFVPLFACKKDTPKPPPVPEPVPATPNLKLEFVNRVGGEVLEFGKTYLTAAGDSFTVSKFNYYISNIALIAQSKYVPVPESYFVVRYPTKLTADLKAIPGGTYVAMEFVIGVDSARNCSGAQSGGLDPTVNGDMFWDWNTGYIFLKMEGKAPSSGSTDKSYTYHVGGFKGAYKSQRKVVLNLASSPLVITENGISTVKITAEIREMFRGPQELRFSTFYHQMNPGEGAKKFADNYADMFSIESVQN